MKITSIAIKRPVTTVILFILLFVLGLISINQLNREMFPDVTVPAAAIITAYPGAGPREVETAVTKIIEDAISSVGGVTSVKSSSSEAVSVVTVDFTWKTDMNTIIPILREKLNETENLLPDQIYAPTIVRFNPEALPSLELNMYSSIASEKLRYLAEEEIVPVIERVEGVADVTVFGGGEEAVLIECSLDGLSKTNIPLLQILKVFQGENLNLPAGSITDRGERLVLRTTGKFDSLKEMEDLIVGYQENRPIYLENISEISFGFLPQEEFARIKDKEGIILSIKKQPGENTVRVNNEILRRIEEIKQTLPPAVSLEVQQNQAEGIENAIKGVIDAAWMGAILAVAILLLFLGSLTSTIIIALVIPISIVASFSFMYISGVTLNITSLMGITLAVGMFVDNAIVVLESIHRKRKDGISPGEAAALGTREVGGAIIASTITTLAVFLPMLLVSGLAGFIIKDIALTITFSLLISLLAALTLTPMLSAHLKEETREPGETKKNRLLRFIFLIGKRGKEKAAGFKQRLLRTYSRALLWTFRHTGMVISTALLLLGVSVGSVFLLGMEFLPETDEGTFSVDYKIKPGSPFEYTEQKVIEAEKIVLEICGDDLVTMSSRIGSTGISGGFSPSASHKAQTNVLLTEKTNRRRSIKEIMRAVDSRLRSELRDTEITVRQNSLSSLASMAGGESSPVVVTLRGNDLEKMRDYGVRVKETLSSVPGIANPRLSVEDTLPEIRFVIKRKETAALGISPAEIAGTLRAAYDGSTVTTFTKGNREYDVVLTLNETDRNTLERINQLSFVNPRGTRIPFESVVDLERSRTPGVIERNQRGRVVKVLADLSGETALSKVIKEIEKIPEIIPPPGDVGFFLDGAEEEMNESFNSLAIALLLAVFLVYAVMASQFESFLQPLIIMFSVPFAVTGMVGALLFTGTTFNMLSFVGTILLVGLVVNNAIVLIDYINRCREEGMPLKQAVVTGGQTRLRPILMTTLTTMLGLLPLALGIGSGSELQSPMGKAILGGLTVSTAITLFFIPALYYAVEKRRALVLISSKAGKPSYRANKRGVPG